MHGAQRRDKTSHETKNNMVVNLDVHVDHSRVVLPDENPKNIGGVA
jgi:hypothetical protein